MKFRDYDNYEIYEDGRIYSYWTNKFLKPSTNKDGYKVVGLIDNEGKRKKYLVHRVVWESVTSEQIPPSMQINHIDEDKTNNKKSNLNLLTPKENVNWGTRTERARKSISKAMTNNPKRSKAMTNNPKISKQVGAYKDGELIMTFPSTQEASRNGFHQGSVAACCRNCHNRPGNNVYKGYTWKYINKKETLK